MSKRKWTNMQHLIKPSVTVMRCHVTICTNNLISAILGINEIRISCNTAGLSARRRQDPQTG